MGKQKSIICRGWNKTPSQTCGVTKSAPAQQDSLGCLGMFGATGAPCLVALAASPGEQEGHGPSVGSGGDKMWGAGGGTAGLCLSREGGKATLTMPEGVLSPHIRNALAGLGCHTQELPQPPTGSFIRLSKASQKC